MTRLSSPIANIKAHYTAVVVGSGYGGGIAASRLARAGQRVCVLERGKEFQPGEYPDTLPEAIKEMQADLPDRHIGPHTGLYDLRVNDNINVFVGCGLGGTSLINANVSLRAEPRVFDDQRWPGAIREEAAKKTDTALEKGYRHAEEMLKPVPYPGSFPSLAKLEAHRKSGTALNERFYRPPINVTFEDGVNHVGVTQSACTLCGDCISGCNYGAKNTVLMNYLPDARNHGAEIYTEVSVRRVERAANGWRVYFEPYGLGREKFDAPEMFVAADIVVLGAGTLGSTEILLRSGKAGLALSDKLGHNFTGNGDVLAFGYNTDMKIDGIGFGDKPPGEIDPVGPCITGIIDARGKPELDDGMVIEEGSIPGALSPILPAVFAAGAAAFGKDMDEGFLDYIGERARELESSLRGAYHGATANTQTYLVMSHDDSDGKIRLKNDRVRIDWPDVGRKKIFKKVNGRLQDATKVLGGTFVPNPTWTELFDQRLVTVHPLGGCSMAEDAGSGVVNHKGQVFSGADGTAVHDGLYVCDGAIVPRSLGINPLFTISALAERCCALMADDHGWEINYDLPSTPPETPAAPKLGIRFTETMTGHFSTEVTDDYERGEKQGAADNSTFEFTLSVISDDLEKMLTDAAHEARMIGTATAPALSPKPLSVTEGRFNLFVRDPDVVGARRMCYRMKLTDEDGRTWFFDGYKLIHNDRGLDPWPDTTTLYITVYDGENAAASVHGKGILRILPENFARQLTTTQATNARTSKEKLEAIARFGRFFSGVLFETYGGGLAPLNVFNPDAPPRAKRPLSVGEPEVHVIKTDDGAELRLTRYKGGDKGPVILSHGLGVSSLIFSIDTIETNLLEYLFRNNYDVWLFDYRASIALDASRTQFSADEIATKDYPAAVAKVRAETAADSVQMVAHCFGSTTFFMAMLAGLEGVRFAVSSQIATHIKLPKASRLKVGLHLPSFLDLLGVDSLTAYTDTHANGLERLYDAALRLNPVEFEEHCNNPTCHRITFMYALLYEHDQLNTATHDALHEMFGIANISAFEHLALLGRSGHLVGADGSDIYMPHLDRLAIPITFIHGAENSCFLPESTEITVNLLSEKNGRDLYNRIVIPDYGHIDCIFGKNAVRDVYPHILAGLEATNP